MMSDFIDRQKLLNKKKIFVSDRIWSISKA